MHRTGRAVEFLSVERDPVPARPVIGTTLCDAEAPMDEERYWPFPIVKPEPSGTSSLGIRSFMRRAFNEGYIGPGVAPTTLWRRSHRPAVALR